jgi:DNA-binding NtrC family response regulator
VDTFGLHMADERIKVLVVEDDGDSRELLAELLQPEFDVRTAPDGLRGLEVFKAEHPDVVVTDETLPGMRGTALAEQVKAEAPQARVILVSGHAHLAGTEFCDVVLKKPLDPDQLAAAVGQARTKRDA